MGSAVSAIAGPVMGIAGGLISGSKAADAASGQAQALRDAANLSYGRAQFNPIGITTGFGSSQFTQGPSGQLTSAGYTLTPEMQAIQQSLIGQAGAYNPTQVGQAAQPLYGGASQLFNLGQQYLSTSPEQARADYMQTQQAALAPGREQQLAGIRNQQFQTGRTGLATGGTTAGGMMQANPELAAYYNSLQKQDLALGTQAEAAAQQRQSFGAGLFGSGGTLLGQVPTLTSAGYTPLQTQLGLANTIEGYGQQPFALSQNLATAQSSANTNAGQLYMQPQAAAANAYAQYQGYSPMGTALSGAGSSLSGMGSGGFSGVGNWFSSMLGNTSNSAINQQVAGLGSSTANPFSDYNTGANGWGNYGE